MADGSSIYLTQARAAFDDASSSPQRALLLGRDLSLALTPADGEAWLYARLAVAIASVTIEEFGVAAEAADDVISVAGSLGEHAAKRTALRVLSTCQRTDGRWRAADRTLRTTLDLAVAAGDPRGMISAPVLRGQMYQALGSFVVAATLFRDGTRAAEEHRDELPGHLVASTHINAARCAWLLRDNTKTDEHLRRAEPYLDDATRGTFHLHHDALRCRLDRRMGGQADVNRVVRLLNEARARGLAPLVVELDAELALAEGLDKGMEPLLQCVQRWRSRREFPLALDLLRTLDQLVPAGDTLRRAAVDREQTATVLHAVRARGAALERLEERPVFGNSQSKPPAGARDALTNKAVLFQLKNELRAAADPIAEQLGWPVSKQYGVMPDCDDPEELLAAANGPCLAASLGRDIERLLQLYQARERSGALPHESDIGRRLAALDRLVGEDPTRALDECNAVEQSLDEQDENARSQIGLLRAEALFSLESWAALGDALPRALNAKQPSSAMLRLRTIEVAFSNIKSVSQGTVRAATQTLAEARSVGRTHDALTLLNSLALACDEVALTDASVALRTRGVEIAEMCDDPAVHRIGSVLAGELGCLTDPQEGYRWLERAERLLALSPSAFYQARLDVARHAWTLAQSLTQDALDELNTRHDEALSRGWIVVRRNAAVTLGRAEQLDHDSLMQLCDEFRQSGRSREAAELALRQAEIAAGIGLDRESRAMSQLSSRLASRVEAHQLQVAALRGEELRAFPDLLPLPLANDAVTELPLHMSLARLDDSLGELARAVGCEGGEAFERSLSGGGFSSGFQSAVAESDRVEGVGRKLRAVLLAIDNEASHTPLSQTAPHVSVPDELTREPT